ncbi:MAG: hypothetical protein RR319_01215 [Bacteroides sp.]
MKTVKIQSAAAEKLVENYIMCCDSATLYKYVELESESDPNFFRWLFGEDFDEDFDSNLTEAHKEYFLDFLNSLR